jgi:glycosyltransferase involved in cell wall biosynthesis
LKILLIENNTNDFFKSRLNYAIYLKDKHHDVFILLPNIDSHTYSQYGLTFINYKFDRNNKSIFTLIKQIVYFRKLFKNYKFNIIHSFRFQPNLISTISNLFLNSRLVIHITGLGIAYSNPSLKYFLYRIISNLIYFWKCFFADSIILQNPDDLETLWFLKFKKRKVNIILGSGVDIDFYMNDNHKREKFRKIYGLDPSSILFTCTTRIIKEKGVVELIEAFNYICNIKKNVYLFLVGNPDNSNPRNITLLQLKTIVKNSNIRILGHQDDIYNILNSSDVFIYPSYYREGIPRSILEALSMSLPIITTNMPGCNLTVVENKNGFFLQNSSVNEIIKKTEKIILHKNDFKYFGTNSRDFAINLFNSKIIFNNILDVYKKLL